MAVKGARYLSNRIVLLGANGQLGHELSSKLVGLGQVVALDRRQADLGKLNALRLMVRDLQPNIIVNAAAYTAVDKAESEPDLVYAINAVAPGVLAEEAQVLGAILVHYSTDYVFDGQQTEPYAETHQTNPQSAYGRSKLAGEQAVASGCQRHLIFRTSWMFGQHRGNFLKTIMSLASEQDSLCVVADQIGTPTSTDLISNVTVNALRAIQCTTIDDRRWGLYHLTANGSSSWHSYAQHIIARALANKYPLRAVPSKVMAISTSEYPSPALRPANSRLNTSKLSEAFNVELPAWQTDVDALIYKLSRLSVSPSKRCLTP